MGVPAGSTNDQQAFLPPGHDAHQPLLHWIYAASEFAQDDRLHLCILAASATRVVLSLARRLLSRRVASSPEEVITRHWPWEILPIAGILYAASELRAYSSFPQLSLAIGWSVLLSWTRLWSSADLRRLFLHQSTLIVWLCILILATASLLPCVDATRECTPSPAHVRALLGLAASALSAAFAPRSWTPPPGDMPGREFYPPSDPAPDQTCSAAVSRCTYGWIDPMIAKCVAQRGLSRADIPRLPWYNEPLLMMREMREARRWGRSTLWALLWFARWELAGIAGYTVAACLVENMAPFGLYHLLLYLENPEKAVVRPWAWLALIFVGSVSTSVLYNQQDVHATRFLLRTEAGCKLDLYQRAMESMEPDDEGQSVEGSGSPPHAPHTKPSVTAAGRIANLMSSDIADIHCASRAFHHMCRVPVGIGIALVVLYQFIGWIAIAGTGVLILGLPFSIWVASKAQKLSAATKDVNDARISVIGEYLTTIRAIKYFAWEDVAVARVDEVRKAVQDNQWGIIMVHVWPGQLSQLVPYAALLVVFSLYVALYGRALDAATGFTIMFLLAAIKRNADLVGGMAADAIKAAVAFKRLDRFFEGTVIKETYPIGPLSIRDGTFRRSKAAKFSLRDVSVGFVQGGLNVVVGPSGSGKTTLLLAILGETFRDKGQVTRPADVAYAPQGAWLQNRTVMDNILFHSDLDCQRYDAVVRMCCLDVDLDELPQGDLTRVGENGSALSGGQRARVVLARALYSRAPLLLLDDIFSTLDAKTAVRVWDRCFCGDALEGRTVVLVTQIPWIASQGDIAIALRNGRVESVERHPAVVRKSSVGLGSPIESKKATPSLNGMDETELVWNNKVTSLQNSTTGGDFEPAVTLNRLTFYRRYVGYFGSPAFGAFCILMLVLAKAITVVRTASLSSWVEAPADLSLRQRHFEHVRGTVSDKERLMSVLFYLGIYALVSILESVSETVSRLLFSVGSWSAGRKLHHDLVNAVMHTDLSWFGRVPVGQVIARLSADMGVIDYTWDWLFFMFASRCVSLVFRFGAMAAILPAFIVPVVVAAILAFLVGQKYSAAASTTTRLVDSSHAPVYSQLTDSLSGLAVIRARDGMPRHFAEDLAASLRQWSAPKLAQLACHRWVSVRLDFISACIGLWAGYIAVAKAGTVTAGLVGLSLSNASEFSENILALVRAMNSLETDYSSLERIEEYAALEPEDKNDNPYPDEDNTGEKQHGSVISRNWPATGTIEFRNATIRYDPDGPDILTDVNLKCAAGERVAIVGRTGAGKSTLVLAMLRFATVVSGQILFDGVDITKVPRRRLRESLTMIPQEAALLRGTVAYNLDPTGRIPRHELQASLDLCRGMAALQTATAHPASDTTAQRGITLDTPVAPLGGNFSHGQRQVLSLCRAIVRGSRLMLLDEATASMDYETDQGIQSVLREWVAKRSDATLFTIAHRLRTIIDYDTIVVMGGGRVLEFGPPKNIFAKRGVFYDMVQQSGEADDLVDLLS